MKKVLLLIWIILIFSAEVFIIVLLICDTEITTVKQLKILKLIENSCYQNNFLSEKKYYVIKHNNKNDDLRVKTYKCFLAFNFIDIVFYIEIIECFYYENDLFCEEIENFIENNDHSITELYSIENF